MPQLEDIYDAGSDGGTEDAVRDDRFRALLGEVQWLSLPTAVRRRFSKSLRGGASVIYSGTVLTVRYSRLGWLVANLLRLIGAPLPLSRKAGMASVVAETDCQLLPINRTAFLLLVKTNAEFAASLLGALAERLRTLTARLK